MIREQDGSIRHGNLHVACDHNFVRFSRWQVHPPGEETASKTHGIPSCVLQCTALHHHVSELPWSVSGMTTRGRLRTEMDVFTQYHVQMSRRKGRCF